MMMQIQYKENVLTLVEEDYAPYGVEYVVRLGSPVIGWDGKSVSSYTLDYEDVIFRGNFDEPRSVRSNERISQAMREGFDSLFVKPDNWIEDGEELQFNY